MRIKKGNKLDIQIKLRNLLSAGVGTAAIVVASRQKLKWDRKDKLGWAMVVAGGLCIAHSIKAVLDDNFVPEKEEKEQTAPGMKDVSEGNVN